MVKGGAMVDGDIMVEGGDVVEGEGAHMAERQFLQQQSMLT